MILYRISAKLFPPFSGTGAFLHGARWNSPGRYVIYCGENPSLCQWETVVHIEPDKGLPARSHHYIKISVPDALWATATTRARPPNGWDHPTKHDIAQAIGDRWYDRGKSLFLRVPSVAAKLDWVVLINQNHPDFRHLKATVPKPVVWDERVLGRYKEIHPSPAAPLTARKP